MNDRQALIIGGTGVLSRAIAVACASAGYTVTIVTDGRGPLPEPVGIDRHLRVDRTDAARLRAAIDGLGVQRWALVVDSVCYDEHAAGLLLDVIGKASEHTIVISTAILYDRRNCFPFRPGDPIAPESELGAYAVGKARMERVWLKAWKEKRYPVTVLRPPHIVGFGCELGAVPLHNRDVELVDRIRHKRPLLLADGGRQVLQIVFNEDVARMVLALAGNDRAFGQVYNCANPEILTGRAYFAAVAELIGTPLRIKSVPADAVLRSEWGWRHCTLSWLFSLDELYRDIGMVPSTSYKTAIETAMRPLLAREGQSLNERNDFLGRVEAAVDCEEERISSLLSQVRPQRRRTAVDDRMNRDLPAIQ